jgi:hypothetical protein
MKEINCQKKYTIKLVHTFISQKKSYYTLFYFVKLLLIFYLACDNGGRFPLYRRMSMKEGSFGF